MKNLLYKFLILFLSLITLSCNVDDDDGTDSELPEITTEGAHTFGCKIDGQVFLPKNGESCFACGPRTKLRLQYFKTGDTYQLGIIARNNISGDVLISLDLYLNEPLEVGVYELAESYIASIDKTWPNAVSSIQREIRGEYINSTFGTNSEVTGTLEITEIKLGEGGFIAGIFEFQGVNQQGRIMNFTDGRFDILVYYTNLF